MTERQRKATEKGDEKGRWVEKNKKEQEEQDEQERIRCVNEL